MFFYFWHSLLNICFYKKMLFKFFCFVLLVISLELFVKLFVKIVSKEILHQIVSV